MDKVIVRVIPGINPSVKIIQLINVVNDVETVVHTLKVSINVPVEVQE
jgi:hypothetical protein